ncbi:MAG: hypothetical protein ABL984_03640 [Pyrinomonadaceae bacterium]
MYERNAFRTPAKPKAREDVRFDIGIILLTLAILGLIAIFVYLD